MILLILLERNRVDVVMKMMKLGNNNNRINNNKVIILKLSIDLQEDVSSDE